MSKLTITVSGCTGSGKTTLKHALKKFLQTEGYNLTGIDDVVEFLKEGQLTDDERERIQNATQSVKENAEITLNEAHDGDEAKEILKQIRARGEQAKLDSMKKQMEEELHNADLLKKIKARIEGS